MTRPSLVAMTLAVALAFPLSAAADDMACVAASEQELTLRQAGKLHEALKALAVCADASCPDEVKAECARRVAEVDAAMPTLILDVRDAAGNDRADVDVSMDGAPLSTKLDGLSVAIDPGSHVFRFVLAGEAPLEKTLILREGEKDRHETVLFGPPGPPPQVTAPPSPVLAPAPPPPPAPPPSSWTTQKSLAVVSAGIGVVGLGLGAVFGGFAISSHDREKRDCASASSCANLPQAREDYDKATENATASTIALAAGAALVVTGGVLWFTARPSSHASSAALRFGAAPVIGPGGAGVIFTGEL